MQNERNPDTGQAPASRDISLPERNTPAEDKALIDQCVNGDIEAFERLVTRYEKKVAAAAYRLCGDRQEGEDMAQEAFIKAWRALAGYRGQASFQTWMMTILTNLWKDKLRKKQLPQESLDTVIESGEGSIRKQLPDGSPSPEDEAEANETHEVLNRFIQGLQPEYKEALILRDIHGFSYEEVAVITGSSLGTVKSRINRARTQIKSLVLAYQEQNPEFFRLNQIGKDKTEADTAEGGEPHGG